jgi:hypothetical protein
MKARSFRDWLFLVCNTCLVWAHGRCGSGCGMAPQSRKTGHSFPGASARGSIKGKAGIEPGFAYMVSGCSGIRRAANHGSEHCVYRA